MTILISPLKMFSFSFFFVRVLYISKSAVSLHLTFTYLKTSVRWFSQEKQNVPNISLGQNELSLHIRPAQMLSPADSVPAQPTAYEAQYLALSWQGEELYPLVEVGRRSGNRHRNWQLVNCQVTAMRDSQGQLSLWQRATKPPGAREMPK